MNERTGFVNAHTHLYSGLATMDMPPPAQAPSNFLEILERIWWRMDRALDERSLRAAARFYVADALLAGTTTLIDHHESPSMIDGALEVLADACQELGIRAVLCYGATERNAGPDEARRGLEECERFLRDNRRSLVRGMIGLHASFTVSDESIAQAAELCRRHFVGLHIHLAEGAIDVEDAQRRGYPGPLERLLELDAVPAGSILAHGVHLDEEQVRSASGRGAWLVQNPRSNWGNQVGYPSALRASGRVALVTDGYPSHMREEAVLLEREAEAHGDDPRACELRLSAGEKLLAELWPGLGKYEDRIVIDRDRVVETTVGGRAVVRDGILLTADLEELRAEAREQATELWGRMESA
jgi:cytosine/adenosine deaminase-related metal-dependent hydrolase